MAQSGARKKKNKKERERKKENSETQAAHIFVSPPFPSSTPTPHDNADTPRPPRHAAHPRLPVSTPRDWAILRVDDSRDCIPHPWRTIRRRKRRVHVFALALAADGREYRPWLAPEARDAWPPSPTPPPRQTRRPPSKPPPTPSHAVPPPPSVPKPTAAPPSPSPTLPTPRNESPHSPAQPPFIPRTPSGAPTTPRPQAPLKTKPLPPMLAAVVLPRMPPHRDRGFSRLREMFMSPDLRALPTATIAGMVSSPFSVAIGGVISHPEDILNGMSLVVWGMPNDERREFLRYLPPDQLLLFTALAHFFVTEPDVAPFLLPGMADYLEDFAERVEEALE